MPHRYDTARGEWVRLPGRRYDPARRAWAGVALSYLEAEHPRGHGGEWAAKHGTGKSADRVATAVAAHRAVVANGVRGHIDPQHVEHLVANLHQGLSPAETHAFMAAASQGKYASKTAALAALRQNMHNGFEGRMRAVTERGTAGFTEAPPGHFEPVPKLPARGTEHDDLPEPPAAEPKAPKQTAAPKPVVPKGPAAPRAKGGTVDDGVAALHGIAAKTQAGTVGRDDIGEAVKAMSSLSVPQIHEALAKAGLTGFGKSKADLLKNVAETLDNRAEAAMRVQTMREDR